MLSEKGKNISLQILVNVMMENIRVGEKREGSPPGGKVTFGWRPEGVSGFVQNWREKHWWQRE